MPQSANEHQKVLLTMFLHVRAIAGPQKDCLN